MAGSEKRIKELKTAFDTPPRYGKGLDWTGYTVHDAANILRRYFNNLPEPIIPLQHYDPFREPLRGHQAEAVGQIEGQQPSIGGFDPNAVVRIYQHLIKGLPSLNRQLLLYILDLLAVFAAKSDINKMTTHNLAAIFQPGILSHPQHDMSPQDYRLSQDVLIFLIDNQDHFLIGMEGTAVDERTVKHIESGPPTPQAKTPTTPGRNNSGIGRSASTSSSAGAESLRKMGGVRRNVSTSSRRSRHSGAVPSPVTPAFATPTSSGVHRSNTLPSKRSPALGALGSPRFPREKSGPTTPVLEESKNPLAAEAAAIVANLGPTSKQPTAPSETVASETQMTKAPEQIPEQSSPTRAQTLPPQRIDLPQAAPLVPIFQNKVAATTPAGDQIPGGFPLPSPGVIPPSEDVTPSATAQAASDLLPPPAPVTNTRGSVSTPTKERTEFLEGPVDSGQTVEPSPATRTFTQILSKVTASPSSDGKEGRKPNKLQKKRMPSANPSAQSSTHSLTGGDVGMMGMVPQLPPGQQSPLHPPHPPFAQGSAYGNTSKDALPSYNDSSSSRNSGTTLKPSMSPSASFRSHSTATEYSEAEPTEEPKEEKRKFWKGHKRGESRATPTASQTDLHGSVPGADKSMSSFGSGSGRGAGAGSRRSLQFDSHQNPDLSTAYGSPPDNDRSEKKGAFDWFHKRRQEHKERADKKERAKSPPGSSSQMTNPQNLVKPQDNPAERGRSMDLPRPAPGAPNSATPAGPAGPSSHPANAPQVLNATPPVNQVVAPKEESTTAAETHGNVPAANSVAPPNQPALTQPGANDSITQSATHAVEGEHVQSASATSDSDPSASQPTTSEPVLSAVVSSNADTQVPAPAAEEPPKAM